MYNNFAIVSIPFNIDNKARLGYADSHSCSQIGTSACWALVEASTQLAVFDSSGKEEGDVRGIRTFEYHAIYRLSRKTTNRINRL